MYLARPTFTLARVRANHKRFTIMGQVEQDDGTEERPMVALRDVGLTLIKQSVVLGLWRSVLGLWWSAWNLVGVEI